MRSSRLLALALGLACVASTTHAQAQQPPPSPGFAVDRLYPSAAGGGWFVMDSLDMHGGLGGAMAITSGYALNPLRIPDGSTHLAVVAHEALTRFSLAATYDRFRFYLISPPPWPSAATAAPPPATRSRRLRSIWARTPM